MKDFADLQKRPDKQPEPPLWKPLQKQGTGQGVQKPGGYGAGGYGKTVPGGLRDYGPFGPDGQAPTPPTLEGSAVKDNQPQQGVQKPAGYGALTCANNCGDCG